MNDIREDKLSLLPIQVKEQPVMLLNESYEGHRENQMDVTGKSLTKKSNEKNRTTHGYKPGSEKTIVDKSMDAEPVMLLRKSYEEHHESPKNTMDVIRKSHTKVVKNQIMHGYKSASNKTSFEKSMDTEHAIVCVDKRGTSIVFGPLEGYIRTNRSFRLRMKQLNELKSSKVHSDNSLRRMKSPTKTKARKCCDPTPATSPNKSFRMKVENASTPIKKLPQHKLCFTKPTSATVSDSSRKHVMDKETQTMCREEKDSSRVSRKENQLYIKEAAKTIDARKVNICNNHCLLCLMGIDVLSEPCIVICKNHSSKCDIPQPNSDCKAETISGNNTSRAADPVIPQGDSGILSENKKKSPKGLKLCAKQKLKKNVLKLSNKENIGEEKNPKGFNFLESYSDKFDINVSDCLEWDSSGLDLLAFPHEFKENTVGALESIRTQHVKPIKEELRNMHTHFLSLKDKYKY